VSNNNCTQALSDIVGRGETVLLAWGQHQVVNSLSAWTQFVYHIQIHQRKLDDRTGSPINYANNILVGPHFAPQLVVKFSFQTSLFRPTFGDKGSSDTGRCNQDLKIIQEESSHLIEV
jgi:hypothetical protein